MQSIGAVPAIMPGGGYALPGLRTYDLPLIYSPLLLKLPMLAASKSLRRSRKAGAARMDAG
ncbi:putative transcriptional regulator (LysR familiy) [Klebsiella quasipneumoniae subsp. similipneumoniae]|nr:putative transcriptional regulator (LysR familiy) [Klebsiella quasipneumoniae subsp. similipneumoniae]